MNKLLNILEIFTKKINIVLTVVCGILLVILALLLFANILTRTFNLPIYGLTLLSVFVVMVSFYTGLARCEEADEHVKVDAFTSKLPLKIQNLITFFNYILQLVIFGIIFYAFIKDSIHSYQTKEAVVGMVIYPVWPAKFLIVIGLAVFWIQLFVSTLKSYTNL